jgi:hypothetical protein
MSSSNNISESSKKNLLSLLATFILASCVSGGLVYYVMNIKVQNNEQTSQELRSQVSLLENKISKLNKNNSKDSTSNTSSTSSPEMTDTDYLNILTINKVGSLETDHYIAPRIIKVDGEWAKTSPVHLLYEKSNGFNIPATGTTDYIWHKVDNKWTFVGSGTEGGWDSSVSALLDQIPSSIAQ